jgi:hypothetical protein
MTIVIDRPCYATREEVTRALDVRAAAYNNPQVDRQIEMASDSVEDTCKRIFYPQYQTRYFDWPNFQYSYPWVLWLDQHEMADQPTLFVTGALLPSPVVIPVGNYIMRPINDGPPYTWVELRRDQNSSFGYNSTPQLDIALTGPFGYWTKTKSAGSLAVAMTDTTSTTCTVTEGDTPGVGDVMVVDTERMIVQDKQPISTGVTFNAFTTSSAADNQWTFPSGTWYAGEVIQCDFERMRILQVVGSTMTVKRAWDGTVLTSHTSGTVYADRQLTVTRGACGTTAATHLINAPVSVGAYPGLVKQLAIAEAIIGLTQEPNAYAFDLETRSRTMQAVYGGTGHGQQREPAIGIGITDLRDRCAARFGRQMRTRVI